jgi:hypothetical protein
MGTMLNGSVCVGVSRHSGLGGETAQGSWRPIVLSGGSAQGLETEVPYHGDPARKSAQAEVGWGFGAQWHEGSWSPWSLWSQDRTLFRGWIQMLLVRVPEADPELSADGLMPGAEAEGRLWNTRKQCLVQISFLHASEMLRLMKGLND